MRVLFVDALGNNEICDISCVPRVGETCELFAAKQKVEAVVWFPSRDTLVRFFGKDSKIQVVVALS